MFQPDFRTDAAPGAADGVNMAFLARAVSVQVRTYRKVLQPRRQRYMAYTLFYCMVTPAAVRREVTGVCRTAGAGGERTQVWCPADEKQNWGCFALQRKNAADRFHSYLQLLGECRELILKGCCGYIPQKPAMYKSCLSRRRPEFHCLTSEDAGQGNGL